MRCVSERSRWDKWDGGRGGGDVSVRQENKMNELDKWITHE